MKKTEPFIGWIVLILAVILGGTLLKTDMLFFRLLVGLGFGYTLSRAFTGFAGSVNRAFRTGSAKLMRTMMFMFFITALLTTAFLLKAEDITAYGLWINPINLGLLLGAMLFGFGMSFSSCCATGTMTDLVTGLPRALITLIFFCIGVFVGFPAQKSSLATAAWLTSETGELFSKGVFFPDLFKWDGMGGYIGALLLTALLGSIVVFLSYRFEKKRKAANRYTGVVSEIDQDKHESLEISQYKLLSASTYQRYFVKPWTLKQGAVILSVLFTLLMGVTKAGWGASTPYGLWFGKVLMLFGVSAADLAAFTKMPEAGFTTPFFEHGVSVQNFGIIVGTLIFMLTAGLFSKVFTSELKIHAIEIVLFAIGGLTMGYGTRLANGCNVGALYSPIAAFSLSGWIFLVFMIIGGIIGNQIFKAVLKEK